MNSRGAIPVPIVDLIFRESEGTLGDAEALTLANWLRASEGNLAAYVEMLQLFAGLEWERGSVGLPAAKQPRIDLTAKKTPVLGFLAGATQMVSRHTWLSILLVGGLYYGGVVALFWGVGVASRLHSGDLATAHEVAAQSLVASSQPGNSTAQAPIAARWMETRDCVWKSEPQLTLGSGDRVELISGIARAVFADGAEVELIGPATFAFQSSNGGYLQAGKLAAMVPQRAQGFCIETPSLHVVDLGTEFGVRVAENGASQVHVFRGKVEATPLAGNVPGATTQLAAGEALSADGAGVTVSRFAADPGSFTPSPENIASIQLLGFYPFDGDAKDASGNGFDATKVSNAKFVEGKEGQAVEFAGDATSFIDLPIDASADTLPDMTWGAWVKPAREIQSKSEIFSTDDGGFDRVLTIDNRHGQVAEPEYHFAAMAGPRVGVLVSHLPAPSAERWTFVAATYRSQLKIAAMYVEDQSLAGGQGGLVSEIAGDVEIGPSHHTIRIGNHRGGSEPFAGAIDNVFIVRGALGHKELEQIRTGGAGAVMLFSKDNEISTVETSLSGKVR